MALLKVRNKENTAWITLGWGEDDGGGGGGSVADLRNEPYVVVSPSTLLTAESVLTAGAGIALTPGAGTLVVSATAGAVDVANLPFLMLTAQPTMNFERYLAAVAALTLVDGGPGNTLTITPAWAAPASPSVDLAASAIGTADSFAHSDHAHQLDQAIVPTWTGLHIFNAAGAAVVKAIVRGIVAQSANLQEWQDSTTAILAHVTAAGQISSDSGRIENINTTAKIANYAVLATDENVLCDTSGGAFIVTLPAAPEDGRVYTVILETAGNPLTIAGNGKNINGSASIVFSTAGDAVQMIYNGTQWNLK